MTRRDAVAKHLTACILDPVRSLDRTARLHAAQALQKLGRLDVNDRAPANRGKHVLLQTDAEWVQSFVLFLLVLYVLADHTSSSSNINTSPTEPSSRNEWLEKAGAGQADLLENLTLCRASTKSLR